MIEKSYRNYMIDSWPVPVVQNENGICELGPNGFPNFRIQANTPEMVIEQAKKIVREKLEGKSIVEIDQFFKDFNTKI